MIVVNLKGGLGNQLFQYSAGRALAIRHNTNLKFDVSVLNADPKNVYTKREFELDVFEINASLASENDIKLFEKKTFFKKVLNKFLPPFLSGYYVANQVGFEYDSRFQSLPANTYLNGYWQSEKYFLSIRETLLKELSIKKPKTKEVIAAESEIRNSNSVSLHIRRGDYVSLKASFELHGLLPAEYYYKGIELIKKHYPEISLFVFSDDISWVKENLKFTDKCTYVDFNAGENSVFDLHLMSLCKHNIIANSSFSWWGAWLNQNKSKIVISPSAWFSRTDLNTKDVIPESWIKI